MAPTPVSAAAPIEQYILTSDDPPTLKEPQLSTHLLNTLKNNARLGPDDIAQINGDTGKVLTYQQFLEQTLRTVQGIRALGLVPGDAVTIIARNQLYTFTTAVAAYIAGVLEHPMYPYLEPELVAEQINIVRPRIIFTEAFALDRVRPAIKRMSPKPRVVVLDGETADAGMMTMEELLRLGANVDVDTFEEVYIENSDDDDALIIFTTGSTGPPKPVIHTSRNVNYFMHMTSSIISDSVLVCPFVSWITGQGAMLASIHDRITLIYSLELNLDKMEKLLKEYKIMSIVASPFACLQMALRGPYPETLRHVVVGGSPMRKSTEDQIRKAMGPTASIQPVYGATETGVMVGLQYKGDDLRQYSNGRLRPGVELQVRDLRTGRPVGANVRGEIFIRTPSSFKGYFNKPEQTREVIDEHRWIRLGDYGYYDEDGFVFILDRLKDIVFYKDNIILPSELTDVIRLHPDIHDAAICALPHPEDRHHPVAFISMMPGKTMTEEELNQHIAKYCDESSKPRGGVVFLERVPRTLSGKVASTALLQKVQQMVDAAAS